MGHDGDIIYIISTSRRRAISTNGHDTVHDQLKRGARRTPLRHHAIRTYNMRANMVFLQFTDFKRITTTDRGRVITGLAYVAYQSTRQVTKLDDQGTNGTTRVLDEGERYNEGGGRWK